MPRVVCNFLATVFLSFWVGLTIVAPTLANAQDITREGLLLEIHTEIAKADALRQVGNRAKSFEVLEAINWKVVHNEALIKGTRDLHLPNLALARYNQAYKDYPEAKKFSASVATELASLGFADDPARIEALGILGQALRKLKDYRQAEVILRSVVDLSSDKPEEAVNYRNALYHLSFVTVRNKAVDRAEILQRAILLFASIEMKSDVYYARLVNQDMRDKRARKINRPELELQAVEFENFLKDARSISESEHIKFLGTIGIAYFDAKNYDAAERLIRLRLTYLENGAPNTGTYFWAVQNLAALLSTRKRYDAAESLSLNAIAQIDRLGGPHTVVKATLLRGVGHVARRQKRHAEAQSYYRQAYAEMRNARSATHKSVLNIRKRIDLDLVDPNTYVFADELGVTREDPLRLVPDGDTVLRGFFHGSYLSVRAHLDRLQKSATVDPALLTLNNALYYALIGSPLKAQEALSEARARAKASPILAQDAPIFDVIKVMLHVWAVQTKWDEVVPALDRLLDRDDLNPQMRVVTLILQMTVANLRDDPSTKLASFQKIRAIPVELWGHGMWGLWARITLIDPYARYLPPEEAMDFVDTTLAVLRSQDSPGLALALTDIFRINSSVGAINSQDTQGLLAGRIKGLTTMLPQGHLFHVIATINYADALAEFGEGEKALKATNRAVDLYRSNPFHVPHVLTAFTTRQAKLLNTMGEEKLAMALFQNVYDSVSPAKDSAFYTASVVIDYGHALLQKGDYGKASQIVAPFVENAQFVARLAPENQVQLLQVLAQAYKLSDQPQKALKVFDQAQGFIPSPNYQGGLLLSGLLYDRVGAEFALDQKQEAYANIRLSNQLYFNRLHQLVQQSDNKTVASAQADHWRASGEAFFGWEWAQDSTIKTSQTAKDIRNDVFLTVQNTTVSAAGKALAQAATRLATEDPALVALLRQRQDLTDVEVKQQTFFAEAVLQTGAASEMKVKAIQARIDAARMKIIALDQELAQSFPNYAELANPQPMSVVDVQAALRPKEALVLTFTSDEGLFVWAINKTQATWHRADITLDILDQRVRVLRAMLDITSDNRSAQALDPEFVASVSPFDRALAYELYQKILAPVVDVIGTADHLLTVIDGPLASLPLAVLVSSPPKGADSSADDLRETDWLIRKYAMTTLPNVSSLRVLRRTKHVSDAPTDRHPFIGFGNPVLGYQDEIDEVGNGQRQGVVSRGVYEQVAKVANLLPLPFTEKELRAQAKVMGVGEDSIFLAAAATEASVKRQDLSKARVLAFATHGLISGGLKGLDEPALVFTPPVTPSLSDDALLTASEAAELKLSAELVILSACNTAASDGTPGAKGLSGLARAFIYAGARSILVSHWPVDDFATSALTTGMLTHMQNDTGRGRSAALQSAILDFIDTSDTPAHSHPRFWAPFVLVGEGASDI